jgi:hypothetical protein
LDAGHPARKVNIPRRNTPDPVSETNVQAGRSDILSFATLDRACHEALADSLPEIVARQREPTCNLTGFQDEVTVRYASLFLRSAVFVRDQRQCLLRRIPSRFLLEGLEIGDQRGFMPPTWRRRKRLSLRLPKWPKRRQGLPTVSPGPQILSKQKGYLAKSS